MAYSVAERKCRYEGMTRNAITEATIARIEDRLIERDGYVGASIRQGDNAEQIRAELFYRGHDTNRIVFFYRG